MKLSSVISKEIRSPFLISALSLFTFTSMDSSSEVHTVKERNEISSSLLETTSEVT